MGAEHTLEMKEIEDLAISTLGLGVAFAIWRFAPFGDVASFLLSPEVIPAVIVSCILVGISFIPHEMAHRVTARSMNTYAEYKVWMPGVVLAVVSSLFGFVFAAPGGTQMYDRAGERYGLSVPELTIQMIGYVSIVGPLINISLAVLFSFLSMSVTGVELYGHDLFLFGARINSFLALANLLPFYPIDGYKILRWNSGAWILTVLLALLTFIIA